VATVQLETSRLISSCVSSEPGFAWWSNNWGYYGGNPLICSVWLGQTLDCILRVERAHPGLLSGYVAYTDHYRGARVEALGCDCVLPERGAVKTQADAAGDWWPRLSSTDPLNHAYQWGWYLRFPTLALRSDAVAAERPALPLCAEWLTETLDCLLRVERAHAGLLVSAQSYSDNYRGGLVVAVGCACTLPERIALKDQADAAHDWWPRLSSTDPLNHANQWGWYLRFPTLALRVDAVAAERPVLPLCAAWLTETLDCLLRIERAHPGRLGSLRAYSEHYRGGLVGAVGCTCMLPYYQRMTSQAKGDGDWYGHYDWAWYAARPTLVQRQADGRG